MDVDGDQVLLILNHQHGWGLPLLVNGTTLLVQGEATQPPCVLALAQGVLRYAKTEEQYESQVLCASDWNIPNCGQCGLLFLVLKSCSHFLKNKKIVRETSVTVDPMPSALPPPPKLVSTYLQQLS